MATVANVQRELRRRLVVMPDQIRRVRRDVLDCLLSWGCESVADDAVLVVTELLTNVHKHADGVCDLVVEPAGQCLLITVSDTVMALPTKQRRSGTSVQGRGLVLIDELSAHWEVVITASGKDVKCALVIPKPIRRGDDGGR